MNFVWIPISIFGAGTQAVRTAAQRELNATLSNLGTTYVRAVFGLPPVVLAVLLATTWEGRAPGWPPLAFWVNVSIAALTQVLATVLLIEMFKLKDFAVGTMLTKFDVVIASILGALFFSETISLGGILALCVVMAGVLLLAFGRLKLMAAGKRAVVGELLTTLSAWPIVVATGTATMFALSYLFVREAIVTFGGGSPAFRGVWSLLVTLIIQMAGVGAWLKRFEPDAFAAIKTRLPLSTFVGLASAVGSLAWYIAFAIANPAYVRAVGQIEVVFTLLIARFRFGERLTALEFVGMGIVTLGVVLFRLIGD